MFTISLLATLEFMFQLATTKVNSWLPEPGVGVFFETEQVEQLRAKIQRPPCQAVYEQLVKQADATSTEWQKNKAELRIEELAPKLPDLTMEFVPDEFAPANGKEAGKTLGGYATRGGPAAAFVYLMTGERKYAELAWDIFEQCAKVNRWGWFPWSGSHMPQIHFGIVSRNLVLIADCIWGILTPQQRQYARKVIAEKCVEPYFRIVLHTPGMGLYHLRSRNQGNNALSAALIGSLFVGDAVVDNAIWFRSLLQTYHWAITHDIGWMGQNLESGIGGYWSVSMQNLYTAAAALYNVKKVDLRVHPGFEQGTYYPIIHEVTVPPVGEFSEPIDPDYKGLMGIIAGKPIELPGGSNAGGSWWLNYAAKFPDSAAHYFASKGMIAPDRIHAVDAHQGILSEVLKIAWWDDKLLAETKQPTDRMLSTDRMANIRSGYGPGETCLYFNGDIFLSAKKEILCTTSGMCWHFPWHQYQIAETGIETEGELFAPSMIIKDSCDTPQFTLFRAESGFSNVTYYPRPGQRESYEHYDERERSILYLRANANPTTPDYFIFWDKVQHKDRQTHWYAWTWHLWNSVANRENNYGRFLLQGNNAVRAERPNADVWIQFLTPSKVVIEQHGIPSQPSVSYQMDHNAQMMRAIAGGYHPTDAKPVLIPPSAWPEIGVEVTTEGSAPDSVLYLEKPPTDTPITSQIVTGIVGGVRYRWALQCKEEDYRVYEATAWEVSLELLDAKGNVIAKPTTPYGHPHPLKLGAPLSNTPTHDWTETAQYFDAPPNAVAARATFHAVGYAHYFKLGKLWLSPIELQPVGIPARTTSQQFVTLVMPLDKGATPPKIETDKDGHHFVTHPDGITDEISFTPDGKLNVIRRQGTQVMASFKPFAHRDAVATSTLKTNSDENAKRLATGLKPMLDELTAERDAMTKQGRKNLAFGTKVNASAFRDERFPPSKVVDNQTAEYPTDGYLDYTLGIAWTSGRFVGYGAGKESLLSNRDYFPIYVSPTYWLLPEESLGWIELELKRAATIDLVRLLNTSNAGLNDFAAHTLRVELYDTTHKLLVSRDTGFGKVFDRPFQQAFFVPQWFNRYTPSFAGMLEVGLTVPFGDGWKELRFQDVEGVKCVRVVITKYWGIGGGLNEIQVYGKE